MRGKPKVSALQLCLIVLTPIRNGKGAVSNRISKGYER